MAPDLFSVLFSVFPSAGCERRVRPALPRVGLSLVTPSSYEELKHQRASLCKEAQIGYRLNRADEMLSGGGTISYSKM